MPFRFLILGSSSDVEEAVEEIQDSGIPISNIRAEDNRFAIETQPMDGWRNQNTGALNQLELDGKIDQWGRYGGEYFNDQNIMK